MGPVVGIDLGTTNTVVGVVRDGQAAALADEAGEKLLPSVVSFHPNGTVLVGRPAKERRLLDAKNTIYSIKRLIGRAWDSEELRLARGRFPFEMREGPGQAALVVARGETYTLPEISAFVLRKAKTVAEAALGTPIERAVITVPANFNDLQRAATKVAGRVAGLEVLRILNEPTAAALAYGYGRNSSGRIAVYDFGGGTFDVTLLDLSDNVFEVLATAGNTFLGGDDIDLLLADRLADELLKTHRYDARSDPQLFERLRAEAEHLKVRLSQEPTVSLELADLVHGARGKSLGLSFGFSRSDLEHLSGPIVDRTFDVCREAMSIARLTPADFDQVLLVGGSTRIPAVRRRVEEFFGRAPLGHISPDEVVAIGAAIQASALAVAQRRRTEIPAPPSAPRASAASSEERRPPPPPRRSAATPPFVVPPPHGVPSRGAPETRDQVPRRKQTTGLGLGTPPAPTDVAPPAPPATTPGLGRGRYRTGSGLGSDTGTLHSAADAAAEARRVAQEAHLPLVGNLDEPTLKKARSELSEEPAPSERSPRSSIPAALRAPPPATQPLPVVPTASPEPSEQRQDSWVTRPVENEFDLPVPGVPEPVVAPALHATVPLVEPPAPPLLVDVTPLALTVETVSGFCDTIIERNTPVPCEQSRNFATATDNQTQVRVRIGQGQSRKFAENTLLGELELNGLPPAQRGAVTIQVSFTLDTDGILDVSAVDLKTGRATSARMRLVGLPDAAQITEMAARQRAQAVM